MENLGIIPFGPHDTKVGGESCTVWPVRSPTALRVQFGARFLMSLSSSFTTSSPKKIERNDLIKPSHQHQKVLSTRSNQQKPAYGKPYKTNGSCFNKKNTVSVYKFKKQKGHFNRTQCILYLDPTLNKRTMKK